MMHDDGRTQSAAHRLTQALVGSVSPARCIPRIPYTMSPRIGGERHHSSSVRTTERGSESQTRNTPFLSMALSKRQIYTMRSPCRSASIRASGTGRNESRSMTKKVRRCVPYDDVQTSQLVYMSGVEMNTLESISSKVWRLACQCRSAHVFNLISVPNGVGRSKKKTIMRWRRSTK